MARHELLEVSIGTFKEEVHAYWLVTLLSWVLPLTVFLSSLVDCLLVWIYMNYAHPWISILEPASWQLINKPEEENLL